MRSLYIIALLTAHAAVASAYAQQNPPWTKARAPQFEDFPVREIYKGAPARVDLASHPRAREYRTQLRKQSVKGPNFAGHFTVTEWGCGTSCQAHMIVDAKDGKVYGEIGTQRGTRIRIESNLLIADPPYSPGGFVYPNESTARLPVRYYVWNGKGLKLIYEEPCTVINHKHVCGLGKQ